jgi:hypothetical protein
VGVRSKKRTATHTNLVPPTAVMANTGAFIQFDIKSWMMDLTTNRVRQVAICMNASWMLLLSPKSAAPIEFEKWLNLLQNGVGRNMRTIMFANATRLCDERGIRIISSVRHPPFVEWNRRSRWPCQRCDEWHWSPVTPCDSCARQLPALHTKAAAPIHPTRGRP